MSAQMNDSVEFARLLREHGFRATFGRVALLTALQKAKKPVTVEYVVKNLKGKIDQANAYRAVEALEKKGLVRRIDLGHDHAHYELATGKHHHHLVCDSCGKIADVEIAEQKMERAALRAAREFKSIRTHSLEFFGTCQACTV
ncbi:MAG: ferric uptake regulator, Fur family [Parcubacteria group bacterium]|nr:ferric uptake regulator, Fur family [Parcubacteria group bacterium]